MLRLFAAAVAAAALCALPPSTAVAQDRSPHHPADHDRGGGHGREHQPRHAIPEFDPATVGAVGTLLAGGVVLVARRRKK